MKTESDPIAEADVYMAYGRSAQAAEILQQGIKDQPARTAEFQAKLMQIQQSPSEAIIRKKMPKILFIPVLIGVLNFMGIVVFNWPIWPGALLLLVVMVLVVKWLLHQAKQQTAESAGKQAQTSQYKKYNKNNWL
jgi:Flp pilus assembly protein TadB